MTGSFMGAIHRLSPLSVDSLYANVRGLVHFWTPAFLTFIPSKAMNTIQNGVFGYGKVSLINNPPWLQMVGGVASN